ncbi:MAG TPA: fibronectin type III domain-containing protein, partial [Candidatus Woesebacteria bacterium]|nr:fibronectin type III domain-containing protein [Candidatus Woesebacteria bacterium]
MIQIQTGTTYLNLSGDNNHISGLNILRTNSLPFPLQLSSSSGNWIEGNLFGSDITGSTAVSGGKLFIDGTSSSNTIGTNGDGSGDKGERNLFMHNAENVTSAHFGSKDGSILFRGTQSNNVLAGNYMGVDKTGRSCIGTGYNLSSFGGGKTNHRYGTNYDGISDSEEANIIACNTVITTGSMSILSHASSYIQGNYIGTNPYGDNLGSGSSNMGINIQSTDSVSTLIKGNTVYNKDGKGIVVSNTSTGITISQNKIYANNGLGIDIGSSGVTANDIGDTDTGANDLMNYPVLKKVVKEGNNLIVTADLDFNPTEAPFTIELFDNDELNDTGYGEGKYFIGSATTSTIGEDVTVTIPITDHIPTTVAKLTATATNGNGSTSEFSTAPTDPTLYVISHPSSSSQQISYVSRPPSCDDIQPEYAPKLFQINTTHNAATLYFAPSGRNTTKYVISYGHTPGEELYGVEYNESSLHSALTYTIYELKPNTTYYFKIRGGNGCMPGDWSNNLYATTTQNEFTL